MRSPLFSPPAAAALSGVTPAMRTPAVSSGASSTPITGLRNTCFSIRIGASAPPYLRLSSA